jgi:hypothetical protein
MEIPRSVSLENSCRMPESPESLRATISIKEVNCWPTPSLWMTPTFQEFHIPDSIIRKQHEEMTRNMEEMMLQRQNQVRLVKWCSVSAGNGETSDT